ncbi:hypothetical protein GAG94_03605 [Lysinibacillus sphaericus]|nr:hypothetical protein GAG94_03605 [Lysinibacillus sphaericus]
MGQLTLSDIQKQVAELDKKEKFYIDKENDQFIYYYPKFSEDKINDIFEELISTSKYCKENKISKLQKDDQVTEYLQFLIIKHFTSLNDELGNESFDTHYRTMKALGKNGLHRVFLDHMFDSAEVIKVLKRKNEVEKLAELVLLELEKDERNKNRQLHVLGK